METKELLKKVRKLEIKTKGLSKHIFSGAYQSAFKGRGMSFSEVRDYQYGDDVRNIDWNVTARSNETHVKVFEEERELTVMLLVDASASTFFGTQQQFKNELITELCATLAFSAIQNNDKVGIIFFTDVVEKYIPPKKGKKHILLIIRELLELQPKSKATNLGEALQFYNNVIKKRSIGFIVSDYMTKGYEQALRIAAKRHDLIGLRIIDKTERELPNVGLLTVIDPETRESKWIDTSSHKTRKKYTDAFLGFEEYFLSIFRKSGVDAITLDTGDVTAPTSKTPSYLLDLLRFFEQRGR